MADLHAGQSKPAPLFWNDADGDQGSVSIEAEHAGPRLVVLEVQSRDRKEAEGVWLTVADAAKLSAWLDQFVTWADA